MPTPSVTTNHYTPLHRQRQITQGNKHKAHKTHRSNSTINQKQFMICELVAHGQRSKGKETIHYPTMDFRRKHWTKMCPNAPYAVLIKGPGCIGNGPDRLGNTPRSGNRPGWPQSARLDPVLARKQPPIFVGCLGRDK